MPTSAEDFVMLVDELAVTLGATAMVTVLTAVVSYARKLLGDWDPR
jgi:hypothetical protein